MIGKDEKYNLATKYYDMGQKLYMLEDYRDSIRYLQKAQYIFESLTEYEKQVDTYILLARIYFIDGSTELSIDNYLSALEIANEQNNSFQAARIYNSIGARFLLLNEIEKAIDYLEKSLDALGEVKNKRDKRYLTLMSALMINFGKAYCEKNMLEKSQRYLIKAQEYLGDDKTSRFYIPFLIVECQLNLARGDKGYVVNHIDELIEGVMHNRIQPEFVRNITDLCNILQRLDDEPHFKWVIRAFDTYTKSHNTPYYKMINAHIWAEYYRYVHDQANYEQMCVRHFEAYEQQVKVNQKNRAAAIDMRIKLQVKDYHRFFEKYIANMQEEEKVENEFRKATDREEWLLNIQQRTQSMSELYVDNENLIVRYITPILNDEIDIDDELASELLKGIWHIYKIGKSEFRIGVELALKLEPYFEKRDYKDEYIRTLVIIAYAYMGLNDEFYYDKCLEYFQKIMECKSYFEKNVDSETKSIILQVVYDECKYVATSRKTPLTTALDIIQENIGVLENLIEKGYVELTKEQSVLYEMRLTLDCIEENIGNRIKVDASDESYKRCFEIIDGYYTKELAQKADERCIDHKVYEIHTKLLYLMEKITKEECLEKYSKYYSYYIDEKHDACDEDRPVVSRCKFMLMLKMVPEMLHMGDYEKDYVFYNKIIDDYLAYIKDISKLEFGNVVGRIICRSLSKMMVYMDDLDEAIDIMMSVVVERDVNLSIHSHMVAEIARLIIEMIYRQDCTVLIGNLGIRDEQEAMECWPDVMKFIEDSAIIHDIGKIDVSNITKKQTRKLSALEYENVKHHPEFGAAMVQNSECMRPYLPIILGHHKNWDDSEGYPASYKYLDNPNPILVNVIQMADNLDAATDTICRAYSKTKTSDDVIREFEEGKGTRYNPKLVKMMLKDEKFKEELAELTTDGRNDICFSIFNSYLMQEM